MSPATSKTRTRLAVGGILVTLLLAAVFMLGSLDVPIEPSSWREVIALYAVSSFITAALLVFGLILTRSIVRLLTERSREQLGARFKSKMVLGAMAISLLPVLFMFFVSYSLLNRTLGRWFPGPLEIASEQTQAMFNDFGRGQVPRLRALAHEAQIQSSGKGDEFLNKAARLGADVAWLLDKDGKFVSGGIVCNSQPEDRTGQICVSNNVRGTQVQVMPSGIELWQ